MTEHTAPPPLSPPALTGQSLVERVERLSIVEHLSYILHLTHPTQWMTRSKCTDDSI